MTTFFVTFGIVAVLMTGMAVGVIFSNKELQGSCGGVGTSCACEEAGTPGACKTEDAAETPAQDRFRAPGELLKL